MTTPPAPHIRILDPAPDARHTLTRLLESVGHTVIAHADAAHLLATADLAPTECILAELRLPHLPGPTLITQLAAREPGLPVIVVTGFATVAGVVAAFRAGAFDLFEKPASEQLLLDRVHAAIAAGRRSRAQHRLHTEYAARIAALPQRQREVLALTTAGHTIPAIAAALGISTRTVEAHRSQLARRLGANSLAALIHLGLRLDFAPLPATVRRTRP
ncbi:MAG: response regulator transcription factor [Mycobacterium sp.]